MLATTPADNENLHGIANDKAAAAVVSNCQAGTSLVSAALSWFHRRREKWWLPSVCQTNNLYINHQGLRSPILTLDQIAEALIPFGAPLTQEKLSAIQAYVELLLRWNRMIGLTAVDDPIEIVTRHFGESLFAGTFLPLQHGRLADVGTGAGFPGLALKIAYPDLSVVLLEPNLKKCAFLHEVSGALDLRSVDVVRSRFEDYGDKSLFDFVCSRALGKYSGLMRWARDLLPCTGRIVLWLGDEDSLLVSRTEGWIWDPPVRIPESRRRVILSGHPVDRSLTKIVPRETKF